jgi:hypothetical protein
MLVSKAREIIPFTIEVDGKTYKCERVVSGTREYTQVIHVLGVGSEADSARYGPKHHRPTGMESLAAQIAREIVQKRKISRPPPGERIDGE